MQHLDQIRPGAATRVEHDDVGVGQPIGQVQLVPQDLIDSGDLVFLSIDTDEDRSLVKPFVQSEHWTQKIYFDDGLQNLLRVASIPTTIVFDKKGEIVSRMNGFLPDRFVDMLSDRIDEALGRVTSRPAKESAIQ